MEDKPDCEICEHFKDKRGTPTPCNDCIPELLPENILPWKIYSICAGQLVSIGDTPIDIDLRALERVFELYDIPHENKQMLLERILGLSRHMIKRWNEKRKREFDRRTRRGTFPRAR